MTGALVPGLDMTGAGQKHGALTARDGFRVVPDVPVGARLRILPDHAGGTAARHHGCHVVDGARTTNGPPAVHAPWDRVTGRRPTPATTARSWREQAGMVVVRASLLAVADEGRITGPRPPLPGAAPVCPLREEKQAAIIRKPVTLNL